MSPTSWIHSTFLWHSSLTVNLLRFAPPLNSGTHARQLPHFLRSPAHRPPVLTDKGLPTAGLPVPALSDDDDPSLGLIQRRRPLQAPASPNDDSNGGHPHPKPVIHIPPIFHTIFHQRLRNPTAKLSSLCIRMSRRGIRVLTWFFLRLWCDAASVFCSLFVLPFHVLIHHSTRPRQNRRSNFGPPPVHVSPP